MSMDRACDQGGYRARIRMFHVIAGLFAATSGLWILCAALLPKHGVGGGWRGEFCAVGIVALVMGTQYAAQYALPQAPVRPVFFGHGDPGNRTEYALRATEPYFKRALCTSVSIAVATAFAVRWVELRFGCPAFTYWAAAIPVLAAFSLSAQRVWKRARSY